jgi:carbonic anhydrase
MNFLETVTARNAIFASSRFSADLKMLPSKKTVIIGCVDPRVDPVDLFALEPGEAVVIRNVGGRLNTATLETLAILRTVAAAAGKEIGDGWNLIVLHHNDCGIVGCFHQAPDLLARHLGVTRQGLDDLAIDDPYRSVALDVAALKANPQLPGAFMVSGVVYDVTTGKVETVVAPSRLREEPSVAA